MGDECTKMSYEPEISLSSLSRITKPRKRVGRGIGSGHGKSSTRGTKGQRARSSTNIRTGNKY